MSDENKDINSIDGLLHPVPSHQDGECPFIRWMGEDLVHCPGVGEWKCKLQEDVYGDLLYGGGSENLDYKPCNCSNHKGCGFYTTATFDTKPKD